MDFSFLDGGVDKALQRHREREAHLSDELYDITRVAVILPPSITTCAAHWHLRLADLGAKPGRLLADDQPALLIATRKEYDRALAEKPLLHSMGSQAEQHKASCVSCLKRATPPLPPLPLPQTYRPCGEARLLQEGEARLCAFYRERTWRCRDRWAGSSCARISGCETLGDAA